VAQNPVDVGGNAGINTSNVPTFNSRDNFASENAKLQPNVGLALHWRQKSSAPVSNTGARLLEAIEETKEIRATSRLASTNVEVFVKEAKKV